MLGVSLRARWVIMLIMNKFMCNSTELDSHIIQYIQAYTIEGNTTATLLYVILNVIHTKSRK